MSDNILIYHRPNYQTDPMDSTCELHAKKIKRQKIVGFPGTIEFQYNRVNRRYYFNGFSPLDPSSKLVIPVVAKRLTEKKDKKLPNGVEEDLELPF